MAAAQSSIKKRDWSAHDRAPLPSSTSLHAMLQLSRRLAAVLLTGCALSLPAAAQVYKCTDSAGKTAYQSQPCPDATQSAQLDLRWTSSSLPSLPTSAFSGQFSVPELRRTLVSSCTNGVSSRGDAALSRLAAAQPAKFRSFCECVADNSLADVERIKSLALRNDRAGLEQLGLQAGLSCASRLR